MEGYIVNTAFFFLVSYIGINIIRYEIQASEIFMMRLIGEWKQCKQQVCCVSLH